MRAVAESIAIILQQSEPLVAQAMKPAMLAIVHSFII